MPLYGAILWDLSSDKIEYFFTQWRKSVRRMWQLPNITHGKLLNLICNQPSVSVQLHRRFFKFVCSLFNTNNAYVNRCLNMAINGSRSKVCNSINHISYKYGFDKYLFLKNNTHYQCHSIISCSYEENHCIIAGNISDLCYIRDTGNSQFSQYEIEEMLYLLCTD